MNNVWKLKNLLSPYPQKKIFGSKDVIIKGISSHSKSVGPGYLFLARKGHCFDGAQFILEAVESGAKTIVSEIFDPSLPKHITQVIVPCTASISGSICNRFFQNPSKNLIVVGITGTNGKTTTAYLAQHLLRSLVGPTGIIATIEYNTGKHQYTPTHTTPENSVVQRLLHEMVQHKQKAAVMEVTSHALDQGRTQEVDFDVAIFTNLSQDHLDYHKSMRHYKQSKQKLFSSLGSYEKPGIALINNDDPLAEEFIHVCRCPVITYGCKNPSTVQATNITYHPHVTTCSIIVKEQTHSLTLPLAGEFNLYNCLAAISLGVALNKDVDSILKSLSRVRQIQGRMEYIENALKCSAFVDFAHTPHALEQSLKTLRKCTTGRLIVIFGCGGERDPTKRSIMGSIAEKEADFIILTNDNPRSESPKKILEDIAAGIKDNTKYTIIEDRGLSIRFGLEMIKKNHEDTLLVAGKGHERHQIFSYSTIEFNDKESIIKHSKELASNEPLFV